MLTRSKEIKKAKWKRFVFRNMQFTLTTKPATADTLSEQQSTDFF